jgi:hypothetical protein
MLFARDCTGGSCGLCLLIARRGPKGQAAVSAVMRRSPATATIACYTNLLGPQAARGRAGPAGGERMPTVWHAHPTHVQCLTAPFNEWRGGGIPGNEPTTRTVPTVNQCALCRFSGWSRPS